MKSVGALKQAGLLVLIVTLVAGTALTALGATYSISANQAVDIPERTITVEGDDYSVSSIGRVQQGTDITVSVSGPTDNPYDVYLYNSDIQIERTTSTSGSTDVTFETGALSPSTYLAAIYDDGEIQALVPVVVAGYDVTADVSSSVTTNDEITMTASVDETASSGDPPRVEFVVGDSTTELRTDATVEDGQYVASIDASQLGEGSYDAYVVVRGDEETKYGRDVILGVSDQHSVDVAEATPTPTPTQTDDSSSGGGGGGGGAGGGGGTGATATPTPTSTATPTPTATPSTTPTPTTTATPTVSPTPTPTATSTPTDGSTTSPTDTPTPTPTPTDVTTPSTPASETPTPTPTPGQPGFGLVSGVLAALGVVLLARRQG